MTEIPSPKELIRKFNLRANKKFGQNFLLDKNITDKIARSAGDLSGRHVIEIGPGPCGLTGSLIEQNPEKLTVIEVDAHIFPVLEHLQSLVGDKLEVICQDATKVDIWELGQAPRKVVANLPYNISTVLLFQWLEHIEAFETLTLMFQKEVAQRIIAQPGDSNYGRISVMVQWLCQVHKVFDLPPGAFFPAPKVTSSVLHFQPRSQPLYPARYAKLEAVVAAAFNQRRKMLRSSLKSLLGQSCAIQLSKLHVAPEKRAEQLSIEEFCRISQLI